MKKSLIISALLSSLIVTTASANSEGEKIFDAKCAACHIKTKPTLDKMNSMVAPAIMGVARHVKMSYPKKEDAVKFMADYIRNPSKEKAICMPQKIAKYGLMPSLKDAITEEEAKIVTEWVFDNFPPANFVGLGREQMMANGNGSRGNAMMNRPTFEMFDKNGDGSITKDEFNAFMQNKMANKANMAQKKQGAMGKKGMMNRPTFEMFDANKDGIVTKDELAKFKEARQAQRAAQAMPMRNVANAPAFEDMDLNKDGKLTKEELLKFRADKMLQKKGLK